MKLETKHLAAYLPYGIEVKVDDTILPMPLIGIHQDLAMLLDPYGKDEIYDYELKHCKPVLNPLEALDVVIYHRDEYFIPIVKLAEHLGYTQPRRWEFKKHSDSTGNYLILQTAEGFTANVITLDMINFMNNAGWILEKLLEWGFDIYKLIDKGLAYNKNEFDDERPGSKKALKKERENQKYVNTKGD